MADLIRLDDIVKRLKEKRTGDGEYKYVYRKSAHEMNDAEMRELIDDVDEITTCLVEEMEVLKRKLTDMEKLNLAYVDLMRKLVELIVLSGEKDGERVLIQIQEWIAEEKRKSEG